MRGKADASQAFIDCTIGQTQCVVCHVRRPTHIADPSKASVCLVQCVMPHREHQKGVRRRTVALRSYGQRSMHGRETRYRIRVATTVFRELQIVCPPRHILQLVDISHRHALCVVSWATIYRRGVSSHLIEAAPPHPPGAKAHLRTSWNTSRVKRLPGRTACWILPTKMHVCHHSS